MSRMRTINDIVNQTALEVGLTPASSPFDSTDESFQQLIGLCNSAGQELSDLQEFPVLQKSFSITTTAGDTGDYDLPTDFNYMIDQTGWDRTNDVAIGGPLSPQDWSYLKGRDLVSQTIYASFRQQEGKLRLFPQPPAEGLEVNFEYISTHWLVSQKASPAQTLYVIEDGSDLCVFDSLLVIKFLKLKFLQAKGLDSAYAAMEFDNLLSSRKGKETGAPMVNAGGAGRIFPYLDGFRSVADTNFGRP